MTEFPDLSLHKSTVNQSASIKNSQDSTLRSFIEEIGKDKDVPILITSDVPVTSLVEQEHLQKILQYTNPPQAITGGLEGIYQASRPNTDVPLTSLVEQEHLQNLLQYTNQQQTIKGGIEEIYQTSVPNTELPLKSELFLHGSSSEVVFHTANNADVQTLLSTFETNNNGIQQAGLQYALLNMTIDNAKVDLVVMGAHAIGKLSHLTSQSNAVTIEKYSEASSVEHSADSYIVSPITISPIKNSVTTSYANGNRLVVAPANVVDSLRDKLIEAVKLPTALRRKVAEFFKDLPQPIFMLVNTKEEQVRIQIRDYFSSFTHTNEGIEQFMDKFIKPNNAFQLTINGKQFNKNG